MKIRSRWHKLTILEINHAAGRVEKPGIDVPRITCCRNAPIGPRHALHRGDYRSLGNLAALLPLHGCDESPQMSANEVIGRGGLVRLPNLAVPLQPATPFLAVPQIVNV